MYFEDSIINSLIILWSKFASLKGVKWNHSFLQWNLPAGIRADFALNMALSIAHKNNCSVEKIAQQILALTEENKSLKGEITSQGYINFRLTDKYYYFLLEEIVITKKLSSGRERKKSVLLEYVSANPTGQLHLGHARNAVIGDTLANVYEYSGYKVIREYYINDRGRQINSLINSVWHYYLIEQNRPPSVDSNLEYKSAIIKEISRSLSKKHKNNLLEKTDIELFTLLRTESLDLLLIKIKQDLQLCGVKFDNWVSESKLCEGDNISQLIEKLNKKDLTYSQEEAIYLKTSSAGDDKDRVLVKANQDYTYFLPDILYHENKLSRADATINVWGAEHHGYITRIKAAYQLLGYDSKKIKVVLTQLTYLLTEEGESKKFSKRLGTAIYLDEAIKWWGKDWLRFSLLMKEPNSSLLVSNRSLQETKKDNLYYIQYSHARCHQLLVKAREKKIDLNYQNIDLPWTQEERSILKNLLRFSFVIKLIIEENKPHHLIYYLNDLAQSFQTYYQKEIIIDETNLLKTQQRILLIKGTKKILKIGLILAGVTAPERM